MSVTDSAYCSGTGKKPVVNPKGMRLGVRCLAVLMSIKRTLQRTVQRQTVARLSPRDQKDRRTLTAKWVTIICGPKA